MTAASSAVVLYVDHAGHPAPLSLCYHATASRVLSSSIDDRVGGAPPSTTIELDGTAYCPQCLSFHDAARASGSDLKGRCPRTTCKACPVCGAAASVSIRRSVGADGVVGTFVCGHCRWTSAECGVEATVPVAPGDGAETDVVTRVTEALAAALETRASEDLGCKAAEKKFRGLVEGWGRKAQEEDRRRRRGALDPHRGRDDGPAGTDDGPEGWSVEALEASLAKKRDAIWASSAAAEHVLGANAVARLNLDDESQQRGEGLRPTAEQAMGQVVGGEGSRPVDSMADLLPLAVPLRPRLSRRCRAELAAGRTGILVKPKVNPLEGDSSLRSGHGQWWKKDGSAIHSVPRVQVARHYVEKGGDGKKDRVAAAALLCVQNPTLGPIRLRLGGPSTADGIAASIIDPRVLEGVLLDPLTLDRVDAVLVKQSEGFRSTDVIELDSMEDAFLELGGGRSSDPPEVEAWDGEEPLRSATVSNPSFREIARRGDTAWVELLLPSGDRSDGADDGDAGGSVGATRTRGCPKCPAFLATLQIEVGDGSWESSLVKPRQVEKGDNRDFVTLPLVIVIPTAHCK